MINELVTAEKTLVAVSNAAQAARKKYNRIRTRIMHWPFFAVLNR
jgi:hypothetical protein